MTKKKNNTLLIIVLIIAIIIELIAGFNIRSKRLLKIKQYTIENKENEILSHYNKYVITTDNSKLHIKDGKEYKEVGEISKDQVLELMPMEITYEDIYFEINNNLGQYYIKYDDVNKIDEERKYSDRYKIYIPYNKNIITKEITNFYDEDNNKVYTINESFNLPIIINNNTRYGVEFNNRLLYIDKEDIVEIKDNHNTDKKNIEQIGTLNYHFFWDDETESINECNQVICISKSEFKKHLDLFNELGLTSITMKEAEMYIDGMVQLPKSILITIDDGWKSGIGLELLKEYKMHATIFLITGSYNPEWFTEDNEYIEVHSHTDKLHDPGKCPGGQGGGLKCLSRDVILSDLKRSREKLNGSTVLCYPFYEYNNYTIELVKEAGFTMAFAGESTYLDNHFKVGTYKYSIPRFVVTTYTTMNDLKEYLG